MRYRRHNGGAKLQKWNRRQFLRFAAGTALTLLLPGCDRPHQEQIVTPPSARIETERYRKEPPWHLGRSGRGDVNPWMVMFSAHIEYAVAEKYRDDFAPYRSMSANWDPNKQIEDIQDLLDQGIDLLVVDPIDTDVVARGIQQAMDTGVPVILVSSYVPSAPYVSWLAQPEETRGAKCVDWLVQESASRRILVLANVPASGINELWLKGVRERLDVHQPVSARIESCQWSSEGARETAVAVLTEGASFDGVVVRDGLTARGVVEAFMERGLAIPPIAGADDWNGWLRTAEEHHVEFLALTGGANLGVHAVELAVQVLSGHDVPAYTTLPLQIFDHTELNRYYRPDLSEHYWAVHELPEAWIERMFRP
jgi:ribose transport system substrate-binding protein